MTVPVYFDGARGTLLGVYHPPQGRLRGHVLHLPAFAEEANATRRLSAQASRALAQEGWAVLRFDLWGCGDSTGDLAQARWGIWLDDATLAMRCLLQQAGPSAQPDLPCWLWGVRLGALMASQLDQRWSADASAPATGRRHILAWQPTWLGQHCLNHWRRIHTAKGWLQPGAPASNATPAPEEVSPSTTATSSVAWLGGYPLSSDLVSDLAAQQALPGRAHGQQLVWLDSVATDDGQQPPPGVARQTAAWLDAGWQAQWQGLPGPAYWLGVDTTEHPALIQATRQALAGSAP